ncbi:Ribosomal protein S6 kinase delta-1 [Heterocephalus glaber]|uniref:Ribosomal protein S6 kinase delta-1 n=1 Tax=Heterocephalus glaber TaxID=10181 RepID=G5B5S1_HETGA|nr:Ribosomal protein S6 kinase delta-1 [Heterocephalus glaber]
MTAPRERSADLARFYTVTEPQRHPRGYTVYKVTARVVSRKNPEDVQEIIVWKRFSDFKKLHKELWQIHKHLFRHSELFSPFAKGIVFGRFDETFIEERRQCAEDLLQFSANIPALYNSKQLEEFFKGGIINDGSELIGPPEGCSDSLADPVSECSAEGFSSDSDLISLTVDVDSLAELDDGMASNRNSPIRTLGLSLSSGSSAPGAVASDSEPSKTEERESRSLFPGSLKPKLGKRDYLEKAGELIKLALKKEEEDDYEAASEFYRKGVDLLLEGVQGLALNSRFYIPEDCIQRWAAEMVVALDALHREGIVCRDLNPNILLNDRGHIQLTYFSRWSEVEDSCDSDAIVRMFCASEVGAITEETEACDWWSLGVVLFELLTGKTLVECHPAGINTHTTLNMPESVSEEARSLIQQLLQFNPLECLGAGVAGVEDIKSHPFFTPVDWAALMRRMPPRAIFTHSDL